MTDARTPVSGLGTAMACPDFEVLSCFADEELEAPTAAAVGVHLASCGRCTALAARLREGFDGDLSRREGGSGGSGCAGEERLVLYASSGLRGDERAAIAAHVSGCDACVGAMVQLHRRLRVLPEVATPIPAALAQRALAVLPAAMQELAPTARRGAAVAVAAAPGLFERLRDWLRLPVLAPFAAAAAALALVVLAPRPDAAPVAADGSERSRALPAAAVRLRVTAVEASVYQRPSGQSDVVAQVRRGAMVEVAGEERGWYEVRLDGGTAGWVGREAFE